MNNNRQEGGRAGAPPRNNNNNRQQGGRAGAAGAPPRNNNNRRDDDDDGMDAKQAAAAKLVASVPEVDQSKVEYDRDHPETLVGAQIAVQWRHGKFYNGLVVGYDKQRRQHHIVYDDGDQRWYYLWEKTFRIVGTGELHHGIYSQQRRYQSTYHRPFVQHRSKDPRARTPVRFTVLVDPNVINAANGDVVMIQGTMATLGANAPDGGGLEMHPHVDHPGMWWVETEMPFLPREKHFYGLFEYEYGVRRADGRFLKEGSRRRRPELALSHFYNVFMRSSELGNHRKYKWREAFTMFASLEFMRVVHDELAPIDFLDMLGDMTHSMSGAIRDHGEYAVEELIEHVQFHLIEDEVRRGELLLVLLGIVGVFGLTSRELDDAVEDHAYTTYQYGVGYVRVKPRRKLSPEPGDWCWYILDNLPTLSLYSRDLKARLGMDYIMCMKGVREVAERVGALGGFEWLSLMPLLLKNQQRPRILVDRKTDDKKRSASYLEVSRELILRATALIEENGGDKRGVDNDNETVHAQRKNAVKLGEAWIKTVMGEAPNVAALSSALTKTPELAPHMHKCVRHVGARLQSFTWKTTSEMQELSRLVADVAQLRSPVLAAAMLRNESVDESSKLTSSTLRFVSSCLELFKDQVVVKDPSAQMGAGNKGDDNDRNDDGVGGDDDDEKSDNEVDANDDNDEPSVAPVVVTPTQKSSPVNTELFDVLTAAKEWIRRNNLPPKDDDDDDDDDRGWFSYSRHKDKKKNKGPKPEEIAKKRLIALEEAVDCVDSLFQIEFFSVNPRGLLFEMSRCHCFKGSAEAVIQALCSLGAQSDGFQRYGVVMAEFLTSQGVKMLEDVGPSVARVPQDVCRLIAIIDSTLPSNSTPRSVFLFTLTMAAMGRSGLTMLDFSPSLASVFERHYMWEMLFDRHSYKARATDDFSSLLRAVAELLLVTAGSILSSEIVLRTLHIVLKHRKHFLSLMHLLSNRSVDQNMLDARHMVLHEFDSTLAEVQCFVNFFCSCGVPIDTSEMKETVSLLTRDYDTLQLKAVSGAFTQLLKPYGTDIAWLYQMRGSALFLALWRREGRSVSQNLIPEAPPINPGLQLNAALNQEAMERQQRIDEFRNHIEQLPEEERPRARVLLAELERRNREELRREALEAVPEEADVLRLNVGGARERAIDQSTVVNVLLPSVKRLWRQLMESVRTQEISFQQLEDSFGAVNTHEECGAELYTLAATGSGRWDADETRQQWVEDSFASLKDYLLLNKLRQWLPGLSRLRESLNELFESDVQADSYYLKLEFVSASHSQDLATQKLSAMHELVAPVKDELGELYTSLQLDFLTQLSQSNALLRWLLDHSNQTEFNQLLQVCRPNTDEPRLLSSIASLVHIRTLLLQPLYVRPPFQDLQEFLGLFREEVEVSRDEISHLENIQQSFEQLIDVFEKQTRSPGIKSCYEVRDISQRGSFVLRSRAVEDEILCLEMKAAGVGADDENAEAPPTREESLEYLLDLRSKLMMTEIPTELEAEFQVSALVESFVVQLQLLSDMRDELHTLYTSGHFGYQEGFEKRYSFRVDGVPMMQAELKSLKDEVSAWRQLVQNARDTHYFLNYFTMREILRLLDLMRSVVENDDGESDVVPPPPEDVELPSPPALDSHPVPVNCWACPACTFNNPLNARSCEMCGTQYCAPAVDEVALVDVPPPPEDPLVECWSLLHLVSSHVERTDARRAAVGFVKKSSDKNDEADTILNALGETLDSLFAVLIDGKKRVPTIRAVPPPGETAQHRADMLIAVAEEVDAVPLWVACAESPGHVIDVVLSVFLRRARLPEPGEILFCSHDTQLEDIELVFWRFIHAKSNGRGECVFCVADIHMLSYTLQVAVVERLRELLSDYGTDDCASLLFVSGEPRQVLLNAFSQQSVDLPPLDAESLQVACDHAFTMHCGETSCVRATINGGGKTHTILRTVSDRQKYQSLVYVRVPFRESSSAASLVTHLSRVEAANSGALALHLDVGHIIPANANTVLFEFLLLGIIKNRQTSRVYHRRRQDVCYIEVPNTRGEKTAAALSFLRLLPTVNCAVSGEQMDLRRPVFTDTDCTKIACPAYDEAIFVCKVLRAYEAGKFHPGATYDLEYDPWGDVEITNEECFKLLSKYTAQDGFPSYLIFNSFLEFLNTGFVGMMSYPVFHPVVLQTTEGLQSLKHVFCNLLIETVKDFALRAVPRGAQFGGVHHKAQVLRFGDNANQINIDDGDGLDAPALQRMSSAELDDAQRALAPPPLLRELTEDVAKRFANMTTWEDTEHPVVLFYTSGRGQQEVEGMDILSLNPSFVDQYIHHEMKMALEENKIDLAKDWKDLKSEEGIEILRRVEGLFMVTNSTLAVEDIDTSYVVTCDNLLKMLSIQLRLKNNLPVVIMGETGCGKSSLIRQLCAILRAPLRTLNIHGGMDDDEIVEWMSECVRECQVRV